MEQVREKLKTTNGTLQIIANHLIEHCEKEPAFIQVVLKENKTLMKCFDYISGVARQRQTGNCAMLENDEVFGLAVHYFDEDSIEVDGDPKVKAKVTVSKTVPEETKQKCEKMIKKPAPEAAPTKTFLQESLF